jgi:putative hemolysin
VEAVGNPASQFCVDHGGTLGIYKTPDGEVGYCDVQGGLVEEWTLYRAVKQSSEQKAIAVYLSHPAKAGNSVGNPASSYCVQVGGDNKMVTSALGQMGICEFADHSAIDEWTLFNGPAAKANSALNTLLGRGVQ